MLTLNSVMLGTEQPKVLRDFYAGILGDPTWEDEAYVGWQLGGASLMIGGHSEVKGPSAVPGRIMANLETTDVAGEFERIKGLGARVVAEPYRPGGDEYPDMWVATFADPDNNYFQLTSPMPEM